ncbi:hypothetical protein OB955_13085 [Halobacteria archaeon AArc-m2/3/4]|uniref:Uncharacterized protein n=1 Tax=Natronoglomus mannanivorans TaxID=2979990 RepID=A0ABT2QFJ8_9EURY|nr:hypothetical protein [Halobacteria archaeon AArc-m2/3/4]
MRETPLVAGRIRMELESAVVDFFAFLPDLIIGLVILLVGYVLGSKLEPVVRRIAQRAHADEKVTETPLGVLFPDRPGAVADAVGVLVKYYIVLLAAFGAAEYLGFQTVTGWFESVIGYVPSFAAGLLILAVGFFVADYVATAVRESEVVGDSSYAPLAGAVTKAFLSFVVVVIGLDTLGVNVTILYTFAETFALAAGLAFALAVGIALGWGGKDYVAENLDDWLPDSSDSGLSSEADPDGKPATPSDD